MRQRSNLLEYADGLQSMFSGEDTDEACAAAVNFAEVLVMVREALRSKT